MLNSADLPATVPLTVLTGFLGAGKTTLLKRILTGDHGLRAAVLVNDFGAINIDSELIVSVDENVVSLANGCVCCSIRDDLTAAIDDLLASSQPPEYIILEASGVADPAGIAITFTTENYARGVRLDSIICILDAERVFETPEQMPLQLSQIAASDLLLINKIDLIDARQTDRIDTWLSENFYRQRIIKTSQCEVPLEVLLASGHFSPSEDSFAKDHHGNDAGHNHDCNDETCTHAAHDASGFRTWSYETRSTLSLGALEQVLSKLPKSVYRCKGILNCAEESGKKTIVQVVGKRVAISDGGTWNQSEPLSKFVIIAANDETNLDSLKDQFDQCLACFVYE